MKPAPDYGEPWTTNLNIRGVAVDRNGTYVIDTVAKMKRAVACINACVGLADPAKEIAELRHTLSGRTVSCEQCNTLAAENQSMREAIREAHNAIKASPYPDQQALAKLQPFITPKP